MPAKPVVDRRPIYVTVGCLFLGSVGVLMTKGNGEISQPMRASIDRSPTILAQDRCAWTEAVTGSIPGHNLDSMGSTTMEECKAKCDQNPACRSIDYNQGSSYCALGDCVVSEASNNNSPSYVNTACLETVVSTDFCPPYHPSCPVTIRPGGSVGDRCSIPCAVGNGARWCPTGTDHSGHPNTPWGWCAKAR